MAWTIEAAVYEFGMIRPLELVRLPEPRRALVVILDESPQPYRLTGLAADQPMQEPLTLDQRVIDVQDIGELEDRGDYIFLNFGLQHQPPYLHLTGKDAERLRAWMVEQGADERQIPSGHLTSDAITHFENLLREHGTLQPLQQQQLLQEVHRLRADRDEVMRWNARVVQMLLDNSEEVDQAFRDNKVRAVGCTLGTGCKVRADGSCQHTDEIELAAMPKEDIPF
jgi:hypothetical protein